MKKLMIFLVIIMYAVFVSQCQPQSEKNKIDHSTHEGHNHDEHNHGESDHEEDAEDVDEEQPNDEHNHEESVHEESSHEGHTHDEPGHTDGLTISEQSQQLAGITLDTVSFSALNQSIEIPGQVGFNEDRLAHITPRFNGVVRNVLVNIGNYVKKETILAVVESNSNLTQYNIKTPFNGHIIEKHVTLGEYAKEDDILFVIADLSRVWINCDIYASYINLIQKGQSVKITSLDNKQTTIGSIDYISPVFKNSGSSAIARMVISNPNRTWRPGMFIRAKVKMKSNDSLLVVKSNAIQLLDGEPVIFKKGPGNSFINTRVVTGERSSDFTEIVSGVNIGDVYVSDGAFELKATIITRSMDPHAGHGH